MCVAYLVRKDRFETAAEIPEIISSLVHLHSFTIIFDLRHYPIGTFLESIIHRLACLSLYKMYKGFFFLISRCLLTWIMKQRKKTTLPIYWD